MSRLNTLISANDNSNTEYINDLITQELEKYENIINIISKFENKKYLDSEIIDYKNIIISSNLEKFAQ